MTAQLYRHFGKNGSLLYVGVSLSTVQRLTQHRDFSGWFKDIARVDVQHYATRDEALRAEREAIRTEKPKHNIKHARGSEDFAKQAVLDEEKRALARHVLMRPIYSKRDLCEILRVGETTVKALWSKGMLGYVDVGHGERPKLMTTGWQLITYLEGLSKQ